jgi:hypothetical protein
MSKLQSSFFPSGLARRRRAKPEGKKEAGWEGSLPRAAASAALPGAIILPPLRGSGEANPSAALDGGRPALFAFLAQWPAVSEAER